MSRTKRRKRPAMRLGVLSTKLYKDGRVRDGTPTHVSSSCENHGGCSWCEGNRTYKNRKRVPVDEESE